MQNDLLIKVFFCLNTAFYLDLSVNNKNLNLENSGATNYLKYDTPVRIFLFSLKKHNRELFTDNGFACSWGSYQILWCPAI